MPILRLSIRPGSYHDSVVLLQLQRALSALPGVLDAGVVLGTPANRELLAASGLLLEEAPATGAADLLIAVKAESEDAAAEALAEVDPLLAVRRAEGGEGFRPRSLSGAVRLLPEAGWVAVSIPGRHAAGVAHEALDAGRHVFLYSDNVPLADEAALKAKAARKGLLVLGPDCGTAILGGVGFGFANRVRRGGIGLVGASGTGLQVVTSRIHALGEGISQALGTGGRDLSEEVGGATALQALDLLRRDPETRAVVLLGKPPAPAVAARLLAAARGLGKPVVIQLLGFVPPLDRIGSVCFARSLDEAARLAVELAREEGAEIPRAGEGGRGGFLRGLFCGGTLAYEIQLGLRAFLAPLRSNAPTQGVIPLADPLRSEGHAILDLGADEFTVGRLHPMIDPDLRCRRLLQEAADPDVGVILLDVVLGQGAHADPAGELAPAIAEAREQARAAGRGLAVLALLVGTDEDPQDLEEQARTLMRAGAEVYRTVGEVVGSALALLAPRSGPEPGRTVPLEAIRPPVAVLNVGLESFARSFEAQGAQVVAVDWRPPAGGNEKLAALLARMK